MTDTALQTVNDIENEKNIPELKFNELTTVIPISKIIELRNKKLTYSQIGKILGCSRENICMRLQPFRHSIENIKQVKDNRADTLAVISDTVLNSLTIEDIKKASAYQRVGMFGILYDKERLERGESTQNVAYANLSDKDLDTKIQELERKLGTSTGI
jgi:hypothetical protein